MFLSESAYNGLMAAMAAVAVAVFFTLYRVRAGYGIFRTGGWGPSVNNRLGWVLMEAPAFLTMLTVWALSPRRSELAPLVMFLLYELHYFQRSFVFPLLIRGRSRMPLAILLMGALFNLLNAYIQGAWLFYFAPQGMYAPDWLLTPQFIGGCLLFLGGMLVNLQSDAIIRSLRKPGDTRHYLPRGGMYDYVTSANYFGEIVQWGGFALLTFSLPGLLFFVWTLANLVPRADAIYRRYRQEFGDQLGRRKRIFPFIY